MSFGKSARAPGIEMTVLSVAQRAQIGTPGLGPKAGPTETFVVVRYSIKNTGTSPLSNSDRPDVRLVDGKGQSYVSDRSAAVLQAGIDDKLDDLISDLNPNVSAQPVAVWKVDKSAFDKSTWRLVAALGGLSAQMADAVRWPFASDGPPPLTFLLK